MRSSSSTDSSTRKATSSTSHGCGAYLNTRPAGRKSRPLGATVTCVVPSASPKSGEWHTSRTVHPAVPQTEPPRTVAGTGGRLPKRHKGPSATNAPPATDAPPAATRSAIPAAAAAGSGQPCAKTVTASPRASPASGESFSSRGSG